FKARIRRRRIQVGSSRRTSMERYVTRSGKCVQIPPAATSKGPGNRPFYLEQLLQPWGSATGTTKPSRDGSWTVTRELTEQEPWPQNGRGSDPHERLRWSELGG